MTSIDAGSDWRIGDVGDPGLQAWLRRKVKTHLFITQERFEADDLVQEMNLHLLEALPLFPSSTKSWPHFCRSLVFRKIQHAHRPRTTKTNPPVPAMTEAAAPIPARKGPTRAEPRPDPRFRLSRQLGSQAIEKVAKQTGIPTKTLRAPIPRIKQAMQKRYPNIYGAPKQNIGYQGMIRWEPTSNLPQPKPPEPEPGGGIVVWLNPSEPRTSSQKPAKTNPTATRQAKHKPERQQAKKPSRTRKPTRNTARSRKQQNRREKKRASRRQARATHRQNQPKNQPNQTPSSPKTRFPQAKQNTQPRRRRQDPKDSHQRPRSRPGQPSSLPVSQVGK